MRVFMEFVDDEEKLAKINIIGYQVARYEQINKERTYILVEEVID